MKFSTNTMSEKSLFSYDTESGGDGEIYVKERVNIINLLSTTFQKVLNILGYVIIVSYLTSSSFCMLKEESGRSYLTSGLLLAAGLSSICLEFSKFQISGGNRLGYLLCTLIFLIQTKEQCPGKGDLYAMGSDQRNKQWQSRLQIVQGAVIITCSTQIIIGTLDLRRFLVKFIKPVSIVPVILFLSVSVIKTSTVTMARTCGISFTIACSVTIGSYFIFYHLLRRNGKDLECSTSFIRRNLFIAVICVLGLWLKCMILSEVELLEIKSAARTDVYTGAMNYVPEFIVPLPYKWGGPKFQIEAIAIILPASFLSVIGILAQYYTREETVITKKEQKETQHLSSIIVWEAILCLISTSFATVMGFDIEFKDKKKKFIGCYVGVILILIAFLGKFCVLLSIIPEPLVAVIVFSVFISKSFEALNLIRSVNMESQLNIYTIGVALFLGYVIPDTVRNDSWHEDTDMNQSTMESIFSSLLLTEFIVAGVVAIVFDNLSRVLRNYAEASPSTACANKKTVPASNEKKQDYDENEETSISLCDCIFPLCV